MSTEAESGRNLKILFFLALKMEADTAMNCREPLQSGKGKGVDAGG